MSTSVAVPPAFPHRKAGHCGSGALRDLLEHHRLDYGQGPLSEGAVFGLAGGLGFLYLELPAITPPFYLVGRTADLERDITGHLGLGLEIRDGDDPQEGWRWVREEIDAGRPPMVWADIAELEYLRVRMSNTRHDIVIVGYDEAEQVAYVADNDRDELQRCSLASLAAARSSDGFPGPNRHTTFIYDWPEALTAPEQAVGLALARAVENMRGGGDALASLPGAAGLDGVDLLASAYPMWPEQLGDGLTGALKSLWAFIVKTGTGGAMFRSLHAEFLHDMGQLLDDANLRAAAAVYDELVAAWVALAGAARAGDHAGGVPHVLSIRELEHAGVAALEAVR